MPPMPAARDVFGSVSVVIPAYNAGAFIVDTLTDVRTWLQEAGLEHEILVVDDGSRDQTAALARGAGPGVTVLSYPANRGKGHAVRWGMARATRPWRLFMDADNSTTINHLDRFGVAVLEARARGTAPEVLIASRRLGHSTIVRRQHRVRQMLGKSFPYLVRALALPDLSDTQCGFKVFSARAASAIFPLARVDRFAFDVELLMLAKRQGLAIAEVPVDWDNPTTSTLRVSTDTFQMFADVLRCCWRLRKGARHPAPRSATGA